MKYIVMPFILAVYHPINLIGSVMVWIGCFLWGFQIRNFWEIMIPNPHLYDRTNFKVYLRDSYGYMHYRVFGY